MRLGFIAVFAACVGATSLLTASDASACGGCFVPPSNPTIVSGHRMALAITPSQTVLWDQIQYSGEAGEFAWVLPVKQGAYIELSTDAWFETLDAATNVNVVAPPVSCKQNFGFGCGADALSARSSEDFGGATGGGGPVVDIVHRGTVGPYETVTLSTSTPGALNDWLEKAGFAVDPATQPTIDEYVKEGFDFIALKLQPDKDVREMKPVRVITPGAAPTLPLRMVGIGTGAEVAITLYVLAEGRWEAENFPNAQVPIDLLAWDFADSTSNYAELRKQTLAGTEGARGWVTTYARQGSLLSPVQSQLNFFGNLIYATDANFNGLDTIAEAYLFQGIQNKETAIMDVVPEEQKCVDAFAALENTAAKSSALVEDPCPLDAPPNDPTCGSVDANKIDARTFGCGGLDDLSVAMTGSHPRDMWVTRLEAVLPQAALKTDLTVKAATKQETVDHWLQARIAVNTDALCGSLSAPVVGSDKNAKNSSVDGRTGVLMVWALGGLALAAALARRASKAALRGGSL